MTRTYVLLTNELLCVFQNEIPNGIRGQIAKVKCFDSESKAERYLNESMSYDAVWMFGLRSTRYIEMGKVYRKYRPD